MIIDDDFISVFAYVAGRVIVHPVTYWTLYFIAIVKIDPDIFFHGVPFPGVPGPPEGGWVLTGNISIS